VLRRVAALVLAGLAIGMIISAWAATFVSTLLYELQPRDPQTFATAGLVLAAIGALAGWLPARRASRIDPAIVLRNS
jgi:ABC-type antimicrobial peptide transport system permease subunit